MANRTINFYLGNQMKPALLLLPNLLGDHKYHEPFLPTSVDKAVASLDGLIAESETAGRRYLSRFQTKKTAQETPIAVYNEKSTAEEIDFFLEPIAKGERWGLVSDAGLPCIADPGARLVKRARQLGIAIQAYVGPSAILLGLMLSGFSGQSFSFHGYFDKEPKNREEQIKGLELASRKSGTTQIFIEVPYRNKHVLDHLVNTLRDDTWLCVAWDLTMPEQGVLSQPISQWKKSTFPNLEKKPAIYLFSAEPGKQ